MAPKTRRGERDIETRRCESVTLAFGVHLFALCFTLLLLLFAFLGILFALLRLLFLLFL